MSRDNELSVGLKHDCSFTFEVDIANFNHPHFISYRVAMIKKVNEPRKRFIYFFNHLIANKKLRLLSEKVSGIEFMENERIF